MSAIPGFGGEEIYEEPLPPHDPSDEEHADSDSGTPQVTLASKEQDDEKKDDSSADNANDTCNADALDLDGEGGDEEGGGGDEDDDDDSDASFVVTIGQKVAASGGKLDLDAVPSINGQPIYDLDLASMEERPWRKPGADINDYFNYGFCEETWNMYCERQRKLRDEYGTQSAVNKALFSSINLVNPVSQDTGGRQLQTIPIIGQENKGNIDLSSFKAVEQQPVIRTVLTAGQPPRSIGTGGTAGTSIGTSEGEPASSLSNTSLNPPSSTVEVDFSKPPPPLDTIASAPTKNVLAMPSLGVAPSLPPPPVSDGPPGVDEPAPPGSTTPPPGFGELISRQIPTLSATVDTSIPPPAFNPLLPPPNLSAPPPAVRLGLPNTNVPPPSYTVPPPGFTQPPPGFPPRFGAPGVGGPPQINRPPPLMGRPAYPPPGLETPRDSRDNEEKDRDRGRDRDRERERDRDSGESDADDYVGRRRRSRRRSRSYSPRSGRRHRDDRDRERDRDSDRYRDKGDRDRDSRSRRHRSRSSSPYEILMKQLQILGSRSSRRREDRNEKDKDKKRRGDKDREETDDKEKDKKDREKDNDSSKERERDKDKERKKRRHNKSDDEGSEKREKEKKKPKAKEEATS
uniref:Pre-mRNA 3'-end-processing factor FIP1 n=1 Tax=Syphacia muris TaxID=451379 RepID=A0A0N5AI60_9BILA